MRRLLEEQDLVWARIPRGLWSARLTDSTIEAKGRLERYVNGLDAVMAAGYGLYLYGPNGRGKTCAAAAVAKEVLRNRHTVLWLTAQQAVDARVSREVFAPGVTLAQRALAVDLLVVDDLGKEHRDDKGWSIRVIEQLVRERIAMGQVLVFTSNASPKSLADLYKPSLVEVMKGKIVGIECIGPDRRDALRGTALGFLSGEPG